MATTAERGLTVAHGALDSVVLEARERVLRRLRRDAEHVLAAATNAAVATLAGWARQR